MRWIKCCYVLSSSHYAYWMISWDSHKIFDWLLFIACTSMYNTKSKATFEAHCIAFVTLLLFQYRLTVTIFIYFNLKQAKFAARKFFLVKSFTACRRMKHSPFFTVVIREMCSGIGVNWVEWMAAVLQRLKYREDWPSINDAETEVQSCQHSNFSFELINWVREW